MSPDLTTLLDRRHALKLLGGLGLVALGACAADDETATSSASRDTTTTSSASSGSTGSTTTGATAEATEPIPEETAGPYPGDGSNGPNVLDDDGVVRRDITSSFGSMSGKADGVPLTIQLAVLDAAKGAPLTGAAVYLWQCDRQGRYSLYSSGVTDQNYLRGVQVADASGGVTFTSIFPGAYSGRWPHIHFEVYPTLAEATSSGEPTATSQLALPEDMCKVVYATTGYEASVRNLSQTSLTRDNVFSDDGAEHQLATVEGSVAAGYMASLSVPV
jgi:protocatechuate 3,4-dioxygenase beta subunit